MKKWFSLLFGLQLRNEERYRDGSNGWNDAYIQGNKWPVDNKWLRGRSDCVLPARSWEMPVKCEEPAKIGRCYKNLAGCNFDFRAKSSPEDFFCTFRRSSQEDFALRSKLWPANFLEHLPIFAGNLHFTGISQLRAGKTRSKRPRSHWLSTMHLLPCMWASFYPLDPSRYLFSFSSWRPKSKKIPFFTKFHCRMRFIFASLLRTQF